MLFRRFVYISLALILINTPASAEEAIAVVTSASSGLSRLSRDILKLIYLRKIQVDEHGNRWIPTNLPANDPLRQDFSLALFSSLPEDQEDYWNSQYFNGITPPRVMTSEEAVLRFVSSTPGAIGYVRKSHVDARIKVLVIMSVNPDK
jgi:ABC-type phosphate transport system substrate-binding protein